MSLLHHRLPTPLKVLPLDSKFKTSPVLDSAGFATALASKILGSKNPKGYITTFDIAGMAQINKGGNGDEAIEQVIKNVNLVLKSVGEGLDISFGRIRGDMFMLYFNFDYKNELLVEIKNKTIATIVEKLSELNILHVQKTEEGDVSRLKGINLHVQDFGKLTPVQYNNLQNEVLTNGFVPSLDVLSKPFNLQEHANYQKELLETLQNTDRFSLIRNLMPYLNSIDRLKTSRAAILSLQTADLAKLLFNLQNKYTQKGLDGQIVIPEDSFLNMSSKIESVIGLDFSHLKYLNGLSDSFGDELINFVWKHLNSFISKPEYKSLLPYLVFSRRYYKPVIGLKSLAQLPPAESLRIRTLFLELSKQINNSNFGYKPPYYTPKPEQGSKLQNNYIDIPVLCSLTTIKNSEDGVNSSLDKVYSTLEVRKFAYFLEAKNFVKVMLAFSNKKVNINLQRNSAVVSDYSAIIGYFFDETKRGILHTQQFVNYLLQAVYVKTSLQEAGRRSIKILKLALANNVLKNYLTEEQKNQISLLQLS